MFAVKDIVPQGERIERMKMLRRRVSYCKRRREPYPAQKVSLFAFLLFFHILSLVIKGVPSQAKHSGEHDNRKIIHGQAIIDLPNHEKESKSDERKPGDAKFRFAKRPSRPQ